MRTNISLKARLASIWRTSVRGACTSRRTAAIGAEIGELFEHDPCQGLPQAVATPRSTVTIVRSSLSTSAPHALAISAIVDLPAPECPRNTNARPSNATEEA